MNDAQAIWSLFAYAVLLAYGWMLVPPPWLTRAGVNLCLIGSLFLALLLILRASLIAPVPLGSALLVVVMVYGAPKFAAYVAWIEGRISR